jgi:hypothetical protein
MLVLDSSENEYEKVSYLNYRFSFLKASRTLPATFILMEDTVTAWDDRDPWQSGVLQFVTTLSIKHILLSQHPKTQNHMYKVLAVGVF